MDVTLARKGILTTLGICKEARYWVVCGECGWIQSAGSLKTAQLEIDLYDGLCAGCWDERIEMDADRAAMRPLSLVRLP